MDRTLGLVLIGLGVAAVIGGILVLTGGLSWFGRLPGDIRIEGERSRLYVPIVSGLIVSVVLTVVLNLLVRWLR